ncbi:hypothetical protein [Priestia megaterium]
MVDVSRVLILGAIFGIHYFLSSRASVYWGAIFPGVYVVYCGWIFTTRQVEHPIQAILWMLLGLLFIVVEWGVGRDAYKKKQQNELNKMKTQDI